MRYILKIYFLPFILFLPVSPFCGKSYAQSISGFSTDLPLIVIDTEGRTIVDEPKITANIKIIANKNGINRPTDMATDYEGFIGIEIRGGSSRFYPQSPYLFETRDENGENLNVSVLGLPEENDWILLSNYSDKSFMRNILGYILFKKQDIMPHVPNWWM